MVTRLLRASPIVTAVGVAVQTPGFGGIVTQ